MEKTNVCCPELTLIQPDFLSKSHVILSNSQLVSNDNLWYVKIDQSELSIQLNHVNKECHIIPLRESKTASSYDVKKAIEGTRDAFQAADIVQFYDNVHRVCLIIKANHVFLLYIL